MSRLNLYSIITARTLSKSLMVLLASGHMEQKIRSLIRHKQTDRDTDRQKIDITTGK